MLFLATKQTDMKSFVLFIFLTLSFSVFSQEDEWEIRNYDYIYKDNIKTVKFHLGGLLLSYPIIDIESGGALMLSFDDIDGDVKDYTYTIMHCDADWQPSPLSDMEYIDGFTEARIEEYRYSFNTIAEYTHYWLQLPNDDMRWTKSGNYLLTIYEDEDEKVPAITRRFMVVDPIVQILPKVVFPAKVSKSRTHQEVDFIVDHKRLKIRSPRQEVRAVVLQNGRWDNAITDIKPLFIRENRLAFDYQDKVVFPAGKEFRYLDIRSLKYRGENVVAIDRYNDGYDVTLYKESKRNKDAYIEREDINGGFVIETLDEDDHDLESDYADVLFSYYSPSPIYDSEVYLFGTISDWQIKDEFRMIYNDRINAYVNKLYMKQGFYNYSYGVVYDGAEVLDTEETEGNWYETENEYTVLVYYKPFGARFESLIGAYTFSSRDN